MCISVKKINKKIKKYSVQESGMSKLVKNTYKNNYVNKIKQQNTKIFK